MLQGNIMPLPPIIATDLQRLVSTNTVITHSRKAIPQCRCQIFCLYLWFVKLYGKIPLWDVGLGSRIISKYVLNKSVMKVWTGLNCSKIGSVDGLLWFWWGIAERLNNNSSFKTCAGSQSCLRASKLVLEVSHISEPQNSQTSLF
jgi:hypothetical protein